MKDGKSREWVKDATIVFLVVLLILTFFSRTIMNSTLPEVAVQRIDSGAITAKVRGTGKVESAGLYQVKAETTRAIGTVLVKAGQEVKVGDVLFILGDGTSQEIAEATEKLRQLQLSYQRTAIGSPYSDYSQQELQLAQANAELENAREELNAVEAEYWSESDKYYEKISDPGYEEKVRFAEAKRKACYEYLDEAVAAFNAKVDEAQMSYEAAYERLNYILGNAPNLDADEDTLEQYSNRLSYAETEVHAAETALNALVPEKDQGILEAQRMCDEADNELAALGASPDMSKVYELQAQVEKKENECNRILAEIARQQVSDGKSAALVGLELNDIAYQIEQAKQVLADLTGGEENQIVAKTAGKISTVDIKAGSTPQKGDILCTIEVPDLGYTMSFSCTNDQAKRLHIGDTATVSNYYWGNKVTATLVGIQTDPKNPYSSKLLSFDVQGDVSAGSELTIAVGSKSANYDIIVPNSAIRSDSNGSFVLVIDAKGSPLGNRYYARRVAVTAIVEDDLNSAVTGDLKTGDYVITTSGHPIAAGDQVRFTNS